MSPFLTLTRINMLAPLLREHRASRRYVPGAPVPKEEAATMDGERTKGAVAVAVLVAAATLWFELLAAGSAAADPANQLIRVGASATLCLRGNPSTGYRWQLNRSASTGLDAVSVASLGYARSRARMVGAPASFCFRIKGRKLGTATLRFDYVRPWEGKAIRRESRFVRVSH